MGKQTQCKRIIDYLDKYGSITCGDIFRKLHINGATARIADLRRMGYCITDERRDGENFKTYYRGIDDYNRESEEYTEDDYLADEFDRQWHGGDLKE